MAVSGDEIAEVVLKQFEALPPKRKPQMRGDGAREWVPLSGIVAQGKNGLRCIALGTGMKCLPASKVPLAVGTVLHDWHAEIVALRSLNHFLLEECRAIAQQQNSEYIRARTGAEMTEKYFQPFRLKEGVKLHMYCSEAPCGDASMELTMAGQDDPTPWDLPAPISDNLAPSDAHPALHGRGYFSSLGVVRRKPSRPDAPHALSKSCSDKLCHAQATSLLRSSASLVLSPSGVYLSSLTLPASQYSEVACTRAFLPSGRMAPVANSSGTDDWQAWGYEFQAFEIKTTSREFPFSRRQSAKEKLVPSNSSTAWTPHGQESIIGGVLQGRKQFDPRGASTLCKKRSWKLALEVAAVAQSQAVSRALSVGTHEEMKKSALLDGRKRVKAQVREDALKGWVRSGGDEFGMDGA